MDLPMNYREQLVEAGEVELIVTDEETSIAVSAMIETVMYEDRDKCVIRQFRQNDSRQQRILYVNKEERERILSQPRPWQEEIDIIHAVHLKIIENIEKIGGCTKATTALIDEIRRLYYEALTERPHPDNPYITVCSSELVELD